MLQFYLLVFASICYDHNGYTCRNKCTTISGTTYSITNDDYHDERFCKCSHGTVSFSFDDSYFDNNHYDIPEGFFFGATIKNINIPARITTIREGAFDGTSIQSIFFAESGLTTIKGGAFYDIQLPKSYKLTLPKTVTSIQESVFESVEIDTLDISPATGLTMIGNYLCERAKMNTVKLPENLNYLGSYAFQYATIGTIDLSNIKDTLNVNDDIAYGATITSFVFPEYLSSLVGSDFRYCEIVTLDFHLTKNLFIAKGTFNPSTITTLKLPPSLSNIASLAFEKCQIMTLDLSFLVADSDSITTDTTFSSQGSLSGSIIGTVQFSNDHEYIWANAFIGSNITTLDLSKYNKITEIKSNAFNSAIIKEIKLNKVKEIGENAFQSSKINIELSTAASLLEIGISAFQGAEINPTAQTFPSNLNKINSKAFYETYLSSISFSTNNNKLTIGSSAFANITTLVEATIHAKTIEEEAFTGCINMKVVSPITIESSGQIKSYAFYNCYNINCQLTVAEAKDLNYKNELIYTKISDNAFQNSGITALSLPQVEVISSYAFENWTSLGKSGDLIVKTISNNAFENDESLNFDSITAEIISSEAFRKCKKLNSKITIQIDTEFEVKTYSDEKPSRIGSYAFAECTLLKELVFETEKDLDVPTYDKDQIDPLLFSISDHAFYNSGLKGTLDVPYTLLTIGESAFELCKELTTVKFNGQHYVHKKIGRKSFYNSGINQDLYIPNTVVEIGSYAFAYCKIPKLTINGSNHDDVYNIPDCIPQECQPGEIDCKPVYPNDCIEEYDGSYIANYAFYRCGITDLSLTGGKINFDDTSFKECPIKNLEITAAVTDIPERAFYGMTSIDKEIKIPDSVKNIKQFAFAGCTNLQKVTFGENTQVDTIEQYAFYGCHSLETTSIPKEVQVINPYTYYECYKLGSIDLHDNIKTIDNYAFYGCSGLKGQLHVPVALEKIGTNAFQDCDQITGSLEFPHTTYSIGKKAFMGCKSLSNDLSFGRKINLIDNDAFRECTGFSGSLTFPYILDYDTTKKTIGSLQIGSRAFYNCYGFTKQLSLPQNAVFNDEAFRGCHGFTGDLIIQDKSTFATKATNIFRDCYGFTGLQIKNKDLTSIPDGTFQGCSGLASEIPDIYGITTLGKSAFYGCSSLVGPLHLNLASIPEYAFYNCKGLTDFTCDKDITSVKEHAFDGCYGLKGILNTSTMTSVDKYAFSGCSGLTGALDFPEGLTKIGECAFQGCSGFSDHLRFIVKKLHIERCAFKGCSGFKKGTLSFINGKNEEEGDKPDYHYKYDYFLKIENEAFEDTKFKDIYYLGRFEPDCDYDIGISSIKGIHTSSNYANKTFCHNPLHSNKLSGGAIAGIVIAVIVVVAVIVFLIVFFLLKNKKNKDQSEAEVEMNADP